MFTTYNTYWRLEIFPPAERHGNICCRLFNIIGRENFLSSYDAYTSKDQDHHYWNFDIFYLGLIFNDTSSECKFLGLQNQIVCSFYDNSHVDSVEAL